MIANRSLAYDPPSPPHHNQYVQATSDLSSLEVGIYSLLIIFAIAVVIFVMSCSVFAVKFRQKPSETGTTTTTVTTARPNPYEIKSNRNYKRRKTSMKRKVRFKKSAIEKGVVVEEATDWVWCNMGTLPNTGTSTRSQRTTWLRQEDFNGNAQDDILTNPLVNPATLQRVGTFNKSEAKDWAWMRMTPVTQVSTGFPQTTLLRQADFNGNHQIDIISNPLANPSTLQLLLKNSDETVIF